MEKAHNNLYYIFQSDQEYHPMPEEKAQAMLARLRDTVMSLHI